MNFLESDFLILPLGMFMIFAFIITMKILDVRNNKKLLDKRIEELIGEKNKCKKF